MSKYYKAYDGMVVAFLRKINEHSFKGEFVFVKGLVWRKGETARCYYNDFTPYTPTPQELAEWGETETLSNDNPNKVEVSDKDINLRLECLKLAVTAGKTTSTSAIDMAEDFYDWITKKD